MLDHPTHHQLRELKLDGMADAFAELQARDDAADLSHAEWLGLPSMTGTASTALDYPPIGDKPPASSRFASA